MPELQPPPVLVCDIPDCGSAHEAAWYIITADSVPARVILCGDCAAPVNAAHAAGRAQKVGTVKRRPIERGLDEERLLSLHSS